MSPQVVEIFVEYNKCSDIERQTTEVVGNREQKNNDY